MTIKDIVSIIAEIDQALEAKNLEPDRTREWRLISTEVDTLVRRFDNEVLRPLKEAQPPKDVEIKVGYLAAELAATKLAAGLGQDDHLLRQAVSLAKGEDEIEAAANELDTYVELIYGRWLLRHNQQRKAKQVLGRLKQAKSEALRAAGRAAWEAPRPMSSSAPPLFRLNGFGFGLYGSRQRTADGARIATYCVSALWIPILPLVAYWVRDVEDGKIAFLAKARLSTFARVYRMAACVAAVVALGAVSVQSYLESPSRRSSVLMAKAHDELRAGHRADAEETLERVVTEFQTTASSDVLSAASLELVKLWTDAEAVPEPFTPSSLRQADHAVQRFMRLPVSARQDSARDLMVDKLLAWSSSLEGDDASLDQLHLLEKAQRISGNRRADVKKRYEDAVLGSVAMLREEWPLHALDLCLTLDDNNEQSLAEAKALVEQIAKTPPLLDEARPQIARWLKLAANRPSDRALVDTVKSAQSTWDVLIKDENRQAMLSKPQGKAFDQYLALHPSDQPLFLAKARALSEDGQIQKAKALLMSVAKPGWLFAQARLELARLHAESGDLTAAEAIWEDDLARRVPQFIDARTRYSQAFERVRTNAFEDARKGTIPPALTAKLNKVPEAEHGNIFQEYVIERIEADPGIRSARATYETLLDVVSVSVSLGMTKLRRANDTVEEVERKHLLDAAERAFVAIGDAGEGVPDYHLGLGQVYHRLGRAAEGERELAKVLALNDDTLALGVVGVYRELGLINRAREIASELWGRAPKEIQFEAAKLMSLMANRLEDKELWLGRADQSQPQIRSELLTTKAYRLMREGRFAEADPLMAKVEAAYEATSKQDSASRNNAGLATYTRYHCTGTRAHLDRAVKQLEAAYRMSSDNSVTATNYADLTTHQGEVQVLEQWFDVSGFALSANDALVLLYAMRGGPLAADVDRALARNATLRRSLEVTRTEEVLAPTRSVAYARELEWHDIRRDSTALRDLRDRLAQSREIVLPELSDVHSTDDPELFARATKTLEVSIQRQKAWIDRARAKGHAPTLAAAQYLTGRSLHRLAVLRHEVETLAEAQAMYRAAETTWPAIHAAYRLRASLLDEAVLRTAATAPALQEALAARDRFKSLEYFVLELASEKTKNKDLLERLANTPQLKEAIAAIPSKTRDQPELYDWAIATVVSNPAFGAWAESYFSLDNKRLGAEIQARFLDRSDASRQVLALFEAHAG
ncbi:MAG: hypothetical protein H6729_12295 [Deltaproteobacteria bacterium]|nr:hypothetical protein [Deltaproteobacteria bacterium]